MLQRIINGHFTRLVVVAKQVVLVQNPSHYCAPQLSTVAAGSNSGGVVVVPAAVVVGRVEEAVHCCRLRHLACLLPACQDARQ